MGKLYESIGRKAMSLMYWKAWNQLQWLSGCKITPLSCSLFY